MYYIDDAASTKKRGRDQSAEPVDQPADINREQEDNQPLSSAPKKSKREDEEDIEPASATSVRTIRRNLKDMSTTDKPDNEDGDTTMHHHDEKDDLNNEHKDIERADPEEHRTPKEENETTTTNNNNNGILDEQQQDTPLAKPLSPKKKHAFAAFGGGNQDDDNWDDFAEDDKEEQAKKETARKDATEKPKYTFGATSGFGTKGWSLQQTATPPVVQTTQKPTFGGFGGSGFGAFSSGTASPLSAPSSSTSSNTKPTFGSFAQASSFALAAATSSTNALSAPRTKELSELSTVSVSSYMTEDDDNHSDTSTPQRSATLTPEPADTTTTIKTKPTKQTEVITGEEDEDTLYQTKAKLYEMEGTNWKERGVGTLRIKQHKRDEQLRRVLMRADSVFRLILNVRLESYLKFEIMQERFVWFMAIELETNKGKTEQRFRKFALKVSNATIAEELRHQLVSSLPQESKKEKE
ncbi:hypothetical protein BDA99DRAFT_566319 [Phascolomyces articulosus]|uniref:RanBD1 domain-containing protein n=1 Tax=Phascolomyces articulosus TaxID=60185 RepID=A0AAD5P778_9FUNG|nr:hypothetical protein BDA99DRAFT_566319 [Phascolomyces articulosus]